MLWAGKHQRFWLAPGRRQHLPEPAQWCFLTRLTGLVQRFQGLAQIEKVIAAKRTFRQERPFQAAEHADAEVVENTSVGVSLAAEIARAGANFSARQLQRREEPGVGRR